MWSRQTRGHSKATSRGAEAAKTMLGSRSRTILTRVFRRIAPPLSPRFLTLALLASALAWAVDGQQPRTKPASRDDAKPVGAHFVDIARQAGLTMMNVSGGDKHKEFIIETTGNGAVVFDYDNDGWPDIFLPNGSTVEGFPPGQAPTAHLYHNNRDGTFSDVTEKAGLVRAGWGQGACVGDYDNDGYLDLFVTFWGRSVLYHNNGDGTFTDVTKQAGLETTGSEWSTGCSFLDYDRDGKADLFLSRYVAFSYASTPRPGQGPYCVFKGVDIICGPRGLKFSSNALYHNNGDGTFTDVSERSGIRKTSGCYGLTALTGDFDLDGWPDIYVACDSTPNLLYHNNQDGTFTDIGRQAGVAFNEDGALQAGMGLAADDYLHNGLQDIVKTNFSDDTPTLYLNRGKNVFDDVTFNAALGKIRSWLGWGVQFYDFDNSGWPGIFIANGHIVPEVDGKNIGTSYREPKVLYSNLRNGKFVNVTATSGSSLSELHAARGLALGDLFNDGHLEAVVNNMNETPSLYRNTSPRGNFISLKLIGTKSNRAALGARVTVEAGSDHRTQEVRSGGGYLSQNDLRLHFGLGSAAAAQKVVIHWPSGAVDTLENLAANQFYVVAEGQGVDGSRTRTVNKEPLHVLAP
jgi:enediyne biosynthesis protein E4